jgi:hypothetical protein
MTASGQPESSPCGSVLRAATPAVTKHCRERSQPRPRALETETIASEVPRAVVDLRRKGVNLTIELRRSK